MIHLHYATLEFTSDGAVSHFPDGTHWGAQPHDTHAYHVVTARCGYGDDILSYCREHELAHHVIAEEFDRPSAVLSLLAKGLKPPRLSAASEEALSLCLQRYVRANEAPFVDCVDWPRVRERFVSLLLGNK